MSDLPALAGATRLVDRVEEALRQAILAGSLRAGEALSVPELARRLAVSRSPVREAVLALVAKGLAVEHPRRGVVVARIDAAELRAIHEIREFLEAGAARLAARRIAPDQLAALREILEAQRKAVGRRDAAGYFRTNADFHRAIAEAAGNGRLAGILQTLEHQMQIALQRVADDTGHMRAGLAEHAAVLDAIAARAPDAAEQAMRRHIAATMARLGEVAPAPEDR